VKQVAAFDNQPKTVAESAEGATEWMYSTILLGIALSTAVLAIAFWCILFPKSTWMSGAKSKVFDWHHISLAGENLTGPRLRLCGA